uniref:PA14 domain-containing protein n=1 Tax=Streptomyces lushanensis TaxID=1434255 RepID=UPI000B2946CE
MRIRRKLALLLTAVLGAAGLVAVPAASAADDDAVEVHGLKGEYYTQSAPGAFDFHELKATAFDPAVDFADLEPRLSATTGRADDVSVRWTGKIVPTTTGPHTFSMTGDNGFRLWVDGRLTIDHWVDDWENEQSAHPVELTAGQALDIKVEYFEHYGGSNLHLRWTEPGGTKRPVPRSAFRLPDGFTYDGALAATVLPDGRTLRLDFAQPLAAPPMTARRWSVSPAGGAASGW